jgi:uncharacterized protein (DUF1697 family)
MKYAVFFRNVNLGRPHCPSRVQLEQAFEAAGAQAAASFLTNGTLVFSPSPGVRPRKLLAAAYRLLQRECGLREPAFLRSLPDLAGLVAQDPFAAIDPGSVYERCVSFLHPDMAVPLTLPPPPRRGDVELLRFTDAEALSISRKVGNTPGSPNALLEKLFGLPATTRSWNTVLRLVEKHA